MSDDLVQPLATVPSRRSGPRRRPDGRHCRPNRVYLVEGDPGAGKTTLALQFLLDGRERGETGLYVTLSETAEELRAVAASHGWTSTAFA